ncbi:MlaE family ABC transporter permease [Nocardioides daeguensis]|uniref:ABC transporter permease n=1 Tax=Nocardioides daeguensis TaxID=908359 RepID=A0ABP6UUX9_9ACTN|nr:ABC transporter permease [Nocardioides daeguensis]
MTNDTAVRPPRTGPDAGPADRLAGSTEQTDQIAQEALRSSMLLALVSTPTQFLGVIGDFYRFCAKTFRTMFTRKFRLVEFMTQAWFITSVSLGPAILVSIPLCVIVIFQVNELLIQIGAVDLAGAGAALAVIREIGPVVSVLVVAGAGATAMCADLGARKIREEIDAMVTLGIDPVERLVVPRVLASALVAICLNGVVSLVGLVGGYVFSVMLQGATPGLYVTDLTLLVGVSDFITSEIKAAVFGLLAGLTACYLGLNAKGGPKGVGDAVNQTVVFSFMLLFAANTVITMIFLSLKGA